jgi:hypothetical protein
MKMFKKWFSKNDEQVTSSDNSDEAIIEEKEVHRYGKKFGELEERFCFNEEEVNSYTDIDPNTDIDISEISRKLYQWIHIDNIIYYSESKKFRLFYIGVTGHHGSYRWELSIGGNVVLRQYVERGQDGYCKIAKSDVIYEEFLPYVKYFYDFIVKEYEKELIRERQEKYNEISSAIQEHLCNE